MKLKIQSREPGAIHARGIFRAWRSAAFSLVEIMVVVGLLGLIVVALMTVFSSTQTAFRASVTQADVLEGGRATVDLIAQDLKLMSPSLGSSNNVANNFQAPVNFYANTNPGYPPLVQSLVGSGQSRTNVLESFFILSSGNKNGVPTWYGTGYTVITNPPSGAPLYSLYRFSTNYPMASAGAVSNLFYHDFVNFINAPTNYSHLIDGVVDLRVRAYDNNGYWMTNTYDYAGGQTTTNKNVLFLLPSALGEVGFYMFSNSLPAAVELQLGILEDRTLQRAESIPVPQARNNYLALQAGAVHLFRQRVTIQNVDPTAYQ